MNPITNLFRSKKRRTADESTEAELAAQAADDRAARIQFHRESVRNGPVKFKTISAGRVASRDRRAQAAAVRKMNVKHRRRFIAKRLETNELRGHLQALGVLPGGSPEQVPASQRTNILLSISSRYGARDDDGNLIIADEFVGDAVEAATGDYLERTGQRVKANV